MAKYREQNTPWLLRIINWSFRTVTLFGVPIYVHWALLLMYGFILYTNYDYAGTQGVLWGLVHAVIIHVIITAHELGHMVGARKNGISTSRITLWPLGGMAHIDRAPSGPVMDIEITIAGPLVNMLLMVFASVPLMLAGQFDRIMDPYHGNSLFWGALRWFFLVNGVQAGFNLLVPMLPMDSGRIIAALLSLRMPDWKAFRLMAYVGIGVAMALAVLAFTAPWLAGIGGGLVLALAIFGYLNCRQTLQLLRHVRSVYDTSRQDTGGTYAAAYEGMNWRGDEPDGARPSFFARMRAKKEAKRTAREQHRAAERRQEETRMRRRLDAILDKINESGINSLTDEERRFLNEASDRLKKR